MTDSAHAVASHYAADSLPPAITRFMTLFNQMDRQGVDGLAEVYASDVRFIDPFTRVSGLDDLGHYFTDAYENVISARFDFEDPTLQGDTCALPWIMHLNHRRLRNGQTLLVDGISYLHLQDGLICYHRDYFDAGQLIYQNVPVLGAVIRWLRRQAS
ncbi:nuclear transport factor 2 family protein [Marinobacter mobilis]|uniref:SnoaL-like domain-containing protein n=1 Tax=Marinobacter mobilis TaxID=488533 RepID=A0A1H2V9R2_9GAMM|nr:nuclear transport factor 2 family protein [Marinobacter mobilis]SDW65086.1 SnoaL-like domain-containing protein [Marinobacter mobilis]